MGALEGSPASTLKGRPVGASEGHPLALWKAVSPTPQAGHADMADTPERPRQHGWHSGLTPPTWPIPQSGPAGIADTSGRPRRHGWHPGMASPTRRHPGIALPTLLTLRKLPLGSAGTPQGPAERLHPHSCSFPFSWRILHVSWRKQSPDLYVEEWE